MKNKRLMSVLCAFLVLFVLASCGMKLPETSDSSPSGETSGSPTGSVSAETGVVKGIVSYIDDGTIKIDLVKQNDAPALETDQTLTVGSAVYTVTGESASVSTDANTAVLLAERGYISGSLGDIKESDFLAVVISDNTAAAVLVIGPADAYYTGPDVGPPTVEPTGEPTGEPTDDPEAGESAGVPDSNVRTVYNVITDGLKVRSGPSTDDSVLGILDTGARVTGIVSEGWLEFTYNGKTAYCSAQFLAVSTAPEGVPDSSASKNYTTTDNVNVRSGPGTTYASLGKLDKGTKVTGTVADGWLKFTYNDKTAYCSASYLEAA